MSEFINHHSAIVLFLGCVFLMSVLFLRQRWSKRSFLAFVLLAAVLIAGYTQARIETTSIADFDDLDNEKPIFLEVFSNT